MHKNKKGNKCSSFVNQETKDNTADWCFGTRYVFSFSFRYLFKSKIQLNIKALNCYVMCVVLFLFFSHR